MATRRPNHLPDKIFSIWMVFLAMPMLLPIIHTEAPAWVDFPLFQIRNWPLTFGPFLFLYARSLISESASFRSIDLLHFIPFLVLGLADIFSGSPHPLPGVPPLDGPQPDFLGPPGPEGALQEGRFPPGFDGLPRPPIPIPPFGLLGLLVNILSIPAYTITLLVMLNRHNQALLDVLSFTSFRLTLSWLKWVTVGFLVAYLLTETADALLQAWQVRASSLHGVRFAFFIFAVSFFGFRQPVVYPELLRIHEEEPSDEDMVKQSGTHGTAAATISRQQPKYEKSGLMEEQARQYVNQLETFMALEKPYLDPDLTIQNISDRLDIPKHYLTQILNERLRKNFYTFVNEYRVEEVKQRILDPAMNHLTVLGIAYDAGFNSKSGFNTIFKRVSGMTPSQFRSEQTPMEV